MSIKNRIIRSLVKYSMIWCFVGSFLPNLAAQNHQALVKIANNLYDQGAYADAASYYERAWRTKTEKNELIYKAGECYFWSKDYKKAAECFQFVKNDNYQHELVGLKYARALKQDGRYRDALEAFKVFLRNYKGVERSSVEKMVNNDIKGCELGIELVNNPKGQEKYTIYILPEAVNTMDNEFAPVPYSDDLLYYSSNFQGKARIYRTERLDAQWQAPVLAQGLPKPVEEHFGNGCFSPDGARFYFTECKANEDKRSTGLQAKCTIKVTSRSAEGVWSEPVKLRDYINWPGSTSTQPFVFEEDGNEILLFISDKEGGFGGLDLYRCERPLESDDLDFSLPANLGDQINTPGDELSPYFDIATHTLYFSSNGLVSLGGLDVFSSKYEEKSWLTPVNLGTPFNSTADDFGMVLKKSGNGGFVVSNRKFGQQKANTRDEDLFEFFPIQRQCILTGKVFSERLRRTLQHCEISLFEVLPNQKTRLLASIKSIDGHFTLPVMPHKRYNIEVISSEGISAHYTFETNDQQLDYQADIYIKDQESLTDKKVEKNEYCFRNSGQNNRPITSTKR